MAKYELQKMEGNFLHKKLTRYCDTKRASGMIWIGIAIVMAREPAP